MNDFDEGFEEMPVAQLKFKYANLFQRIAAFLIDIFICSFLCALLFLTQAADLSDPEKFQAYLMQNQSMVQTIMYAVFFLYFILMESSKLQASLGKMIFGIKVCDLEGKRLHHTRVAVRTLSKILGLVSIFVIIFLVFFNEKNQGLHDIWAKSLVVKKK